MGKSDAFNKHLKGPCRQKCKQNDDFCGFLKGDITQDFRIFFKMKVAVWALILVLH